MVNSFPIQFGLQMKLSVFVKRRPNVKKKRGVHYLMSDSYTCFFVKKNKMKEVFESTRSDIVTILKVCYKIARTQINVLK